MFRLKLFFELNRNSRHGKSVQIVRILLRISFCLHLLIVAAATGAGVESLHYDAEEGEITGLYIDNTIPGYSGTGYVTCFENPGDSVRITVHVLASGFYTLKIAYAADEPKFNPVFVNDSMQGDRLFPKTNGFAEMTFGRIRLNAAQHGAYWFALGANRHGLYPARSRSGNGS